MSQDHELRPLDLVGDRYRLLELVGAGAMGSVWSANNELTQRKFALKVMNRQAALDPSAVQRFLQEARAAGSLRHPSIVEVYDVGYQPAIERNAPPLPFLVMELLEGETLEHRLEMRGALTPQEVVSFLTAIAEGLAVAHTAGIVHRDLKPANLFFHGPLQTPKVLDFGISKLLGLAASDGVLTVAGLVLGSPPYMSPEQAGGKLDVDARSDVWALGVIAYRALSGTLPFVAPNYNALMLEILHAHPRPIQDLCPGLNPGLASIIMLCLEKDRELRPRDAAALATLLGEVERGGVPVVKSVPQRLRHWVWMVSLVATLGGIAVYLLALRPKDSVPALTKDHAAPLAVSSGPFAGNAPSAASSPRPLGGSPLNSSATSRPAPAPTERTAKTTSRKLAGQPKKLPGPTGTVPIAASPLRPPPVNEGVTSSGL